MATPEAGYVAKVGDTVLIIDPDSNDRGKEGEIFGITTMAAAKPYSIKFPGNVGLRYFSRDGFSLQLTDEPTPEPQTWTVGSVPRYVFRLDPIESGDVNATLTIRGNPSDLLALAAELVKRG